MPRNALHFEEGRVLQEMSDPHKQQWQTGQEPSDDDASRNQRIAAMRELSGVEQVTPANTPSSPKLLTPAKKRRCPVLLAAMLAVVVLVSAGAAWKGLFPWKQHARTDRNVTSINLAANNLVCPSYAAWSPNGQQLAVLAQVGKCDNSYAGIIAHHAVAIFDTHGQLVRQLDPDLNFSGSITYTDGAEATATTTGIPQTIQVYPAYLGLAWSKDSKHLALPFHMNYEENGESSSLEYGVTLLLVDGSSQTSFRYSPFYGNDYFDLQAKRSIHLNSSDWQIALGYQWSDDGKLVATPVPSASAPIGNPSGGQAFTAWQPGTVSLDRQTSALNFGAVVTAWSPDGRYLMPLVGFGGELDLNAIGYTQGSDGAFHLAPRDKGLMVASARLKDPADPYATQLSVAWRADGKRIAATDPNPLIDQVVANLGSDIPDASRSISIFDSAAGTKLLTLKTHPLANRLQIFGGLTPQPTLAWNAKGTSLFFLDTNFDMLTVWNVSLN